MSPLYFLKTYGLLQDRALRATIKFQDWPHLVSLLDDFQKEKQIIILKARQLGISWLVAGYSLWMVLFHENAKVLFLSQGENEAAELLGKCKFMHNHLPEFLRTKIYPEQMGFIGFPSSGGEIRALPSTEKAGRSTDASLVVCDEWEFHPYAEPNFAAVKPTIDASGAQFIGLSTADKTKTDTFFKKKYREALAGSGFKPVFLPWNARPGRDGEWFKSLSQDLSQWQIEQEYPSKEEDALSTIEVVSFFDLDILRQMLAECTLSPVETRHNGLVKIYKPFVVGRHYFSGVDISDGRYDWTAMPVVDWQTNEIVATFHAKIPADEAAYIIDELGREYNNALLAPERNQPGLAVINKLKDLEYPNLYSMDANKPGWWTAGGKSSTPTSRGYILHELREPISKRQIVIYEPEIIKEFISFIQPKDDVPQAVRGAHDDWVMAMAITWQMRKHVRPHRAGFKSWTRRGVTV
jgi:hypothetical protein